VIGCGLGDNAEFLAERGFAVTAFDISPTAVDWCRKRFPASKVRYVVGDLFTAAGEFGQFDFVLEVHTLQALPRSLRAQAVAAVAALVRDRLLVVCRGCREPQPDETIPWPLTREELAGFTAAGLTEVSFDDFWDHKEPPCRRFRVTYQRAYTK
jgi:SAM-dependent methyltransferase